MLQHRKPAADKADKCRQRKPVQILTYAQKKKVEQLRQKVAEASIKGRHLPDGVEIRKNEGWKQWTESLS